MSGYRPIDSEAELNRFKEIIAYAFSIPDDAMRDRVGPRLKPETTRILVEDEEIKAVLALLPFTVWLGPVRVDMGGIAMVAVPPEFRRQGATGRLLIHTLREMREQGQVISALYPFKYSFYHRYGWALASEHRLYKIPVEELKSFLPPVGRTRPVTGADLPALQRIYNTYSMTKSLNMVRTEEMWQQGIFGEGPQRRHGYLWLNDNGIPEGYVFFRIEGEGDPRELVVREIVSVSPAGWKGLWGFLANHDSQVKVVGWSGPMDDPLLLQLPNPRFEMFISPRFMLRIVDVRRALKLRPPKPGLTARFTLKVLDEQCPWNEGPWEISIGGGEWQVKPISTPLVDVTCSVQTLSQLYAHYTDAKTQLALGQLQLERQEVLETLQTAFQGPAPYLNDYF